jgi:tetratricopeptide (TPR) repeat protein
MKKKTPILAAALVLGVSLLAQPAALLAAGGSPQPTPPPTDGSQMSAADEAKKRYNKALELRDEAWELEKQAENADAAEQAKLAKKTEKLYKRAVRELKQAVNLDRDFYQAHSSLGYALRKTGEYEAALEAYNTALSLNPTYAEAIEYRAETYLGLNRIPEAKTSYITLFGRDRDRADELMAAMKKWVKERKADPAGADPAEVEALGEWLAEREELANQTASLSQLPRQRW